MLKKLLGSCLEAYRGAHKSVPSEPFIASDVTFPTGIEHANESTNLFVPPSDGVFVIQCEPANELIYYNLTVRRSVYDCLFTEVVGLCWPVGEVPCRKGEHIRWYVWIDGPAQQITAHIRFYPYVGAQ